MGDDRADVEQHQSDAREQPDHGHPQQPEQQPGGSRRLQQAEHGQPRRWDADRSGVREHESRAGEIGDGDESVGRDGDEGQDECDGRHASMTTQQRQMCGESSGGAAVEIDRGLLLNVGYRLLGSVADAEDAVQEACARWYAQSPQARAAIVSPSAWLVTAVSRICLDVLGSARARRERYVGEWLPEPVPGGGGVDEPCGVGVDGGPGRAGGARRLAAHGRAGGGGAHDAGRAGRVRPARRLRVPVHGGRPGRWVVRRRPAGSSRPRRGAGSGPVHPGAVPGAPDERAVTAFRAAWESGDVAGLVARARPGRGRRHRWRRAGERSRGTGSGGCCRRPLPRRRVRAPPGPDSPRSPRERHAGARRGGVGDHGHRDQPQGLRRSHRPGVGRAQPGEAVHGGLVEVVQGGQHGESGSRPMVTTMTAETARRAVSTRAPPRCHEPQPRSTRRGAGARC